MKRNKSYRSSRLNARLSFNDGFAEKPIYSIKAVTTEKNKGLDMVDLIMNNFNITIRDIEYHKEVVKAQILEEMNHLSNRIVSPSVKLNRDESGNLVSPFANKEKLI